MDYKEKHKDTDDTLVREFVIKLYKEFFNINLEPTPPPWEDKRINSEFANAIPSIESSVSIPKQEIGIPRSVPKLDKTGDAKHSQFSG